MKTQASSRSEVGTLYALLREMGGKTTQMASIFWTLFTVTIALFSPHLPANEIHDQIREEAQEGQETFSGGGDEAREQQGQFVGNVPNPTKKPPDFLFKNLKNKEYPLEFLLPFMRVSQLFKQRIPEKAAAPSALAKGEDKLPDASKPIVAEKKVTPVVARTLRAAPTGRESWPEDLRASLEESERRPASLESPKVLPPVISARPAKAPTRQLLNSLKAQ